MAARGGPGPSGEYQAFAICSCWAETMSRGTASRHTNKANRDDSERMPNGKYRCLHKCKDRYKCKHDCW